MTQQAQMLTHAENSALSDLTPQLQLAWDSTSLGELKTCPRKYQLRILYGYTPRELSVHLKFGLGFHGALERYDHARAAGKNHDESVREAVRWVMDFTWDPKMGRPWLSSDPNKNRLTLIRTVVWYYEQFEQDSIETIILPNGKPAVELSFTFPLPFKSNNGEQFFYCGHMDKVGKFSGRNFIVDRKSTKRTLGSYFFDDFNPHNQFTGYIYAGEVAYELPIDGLICDAAQVAVGFTRFERQPIYRTKDQIREWTKGVAFYLRQAEMYANQQFWPMNENACVSGDTIVTVTRGTRQSWKMPVSKLYAMLNGKPGPRFNKNISTHLLVSKDGIIGNQRMLAVVKTGVKQVFLLKTLHSQIKATADHRFLTPDGWKRLDELKVGDLMCSWKHNNGLLQDKKIAKSRKTIGKLYYYPGGWDKGPLGIGLRNRRRGKTERQARLTVEATMNGLSLEAFIAILRTDPIKAKTLKYLDKSFEVHHKDENEQNDSPNNLEALTQADHKKQHDFKTNVSKTDTTKIVSIEVAGEELVYDIAMEAPHHNFIANGLVAHNCSMYGGCAFRPICSKTPAVREQFLRAGFDRQVWDPLQKRGDI